MSQASFLLRLAIFLAILFWPVALAFRAKTLSSDSQITQDCPLWEDKGKGKRKSCRPTAPESFLLGGGRNRTRAGTELRPPSRDGPDLDILGEVTEALDIMQREYYEAWLGMWPSSIDWTGAFLGTLVSGTLRTFSEALNSFHTGTSNEVRDWRLKENLIDGYFTEIVGYYFGQDALSIRNEAFDDILWVVLGWVETIKLIDTHTALFYQPRLLTGDPNPGRDLVNMLENKTWHGNSWTPAFAHRARIFWDLSAKGWDTELCGGGMTWNPRLLPYKNAITNELFVAASISMYLHFPGDNNMSPYSTMLRDPAMTKSNTENSGMGPKEPIFLKAAVEGYKWLVNSNMTDAHGLFTDGFHISGLLNPGSNNTKCDQRNEMVFTYNQGVLLTGQRGLFEATGALSYLYDGHRLIQNVIRATGYDLAAGQRLETVQDLPPDQLPTWYGLGRLGVMEEYCDASGTCNQDGQTFKGIFFHHLTTFCEQLILPPDYAVDLDARAFAATSVAHDEACSAYATWVKLNAEAALGTCDEEGKFGAWWTAGLLTGNFTGAWPTLANDGIQRSVEATDYRNYGLPNVPPWRWGVASHKGGGHHNGDNVMESDSEFPVPLEDDSMNSQKPLIQELRRRGKRDNQRSKSHGLPEPSDPNTRGRGRTVETQGGGLAVLRAYWSISQRESPQR